MSRHWSQLGGTEKEISSKMNTQHFDVQQSTAVMVHSAKGMMLLIPFSHLFRINLDPAARSLSCDTSVWKPY